MRAKFEISEGDDDLLVDLRKLSTYNAKKILRKRIT